MPTREEVMAALQASRAATQANVNRFLGREPTPPPEPEMIEVPEPVENIQVFNTTGNIIWGTAQAVRWEDVITPQPPPPPPVNINETKSVVFEGLELDVPVWTTHITQDKNGTIKAWEHEPMDWQMAEAYLQAYAGQRNKVVMKPEEFPRLKVEIA